MTRRSKSRNPLDIGVRTGSVLISKGATIERRNPLDIGVRTGSIKGWGAVAGSKS